MYILKDGEQYIRLDRLHPVIVEFIRNRYNVGTAEGCIHVKQDSKAGYAVPVFVTGEIISEG